MLINCSTLQRQFDGLDGSVCILQNVIIPEAYYAIAFAYEPRCPVGVLFLPHGMLPTIDFDDKRFGEAGEIDDVVADRGLPPEVKSAALSAP